MQNARHIPGPALVVLYLVASALWVLLLSVGVGLLAVAMLVYQGGVASLGAMDEAAITAAVGGGLIAGSSAVQTLGLLGIALGLALWVTRHEGHDVRAHLRRVFATRGAGLVMLLVAATGAVSVGVFPGWIAERLVELLPGLELGSLDMITQLLAEGPWFGRLLMIGMVVVVAPLCEELIFRGFIWSALEDTLPWWAVWGLSSGLFAAYHLDPIHVAAVLFTGMYLGWMRHVSGSVWPGVVAHFVNNALAVAITLNLPPEVGASSTPLWAAVGGALLTIVLSGVGWRLRRPE